MAAEVAAKGTFDLVTVYDGMSEEEKQELIEALAEVEGDAFPVRHIQVPNADTGQIYKIETENDGEFEFVKTFDAVVLYRHKMNTRWAGEYGSGGENQVPVCSSMDGKTGHERSDGAQGRSISCAECPYNQFTEDADGRASKECKNSMRVYLLLSGKPDLYILGVPASSLKRAADQLARVMGTRRMPLYKQVVTFSLEPATGRSSGRKYNAVTVKAKDVVPADKWPTLIRMRDEITSQYQSVSVRSEDVAEAPTALKTDRDGFVEIPEDDVSDEDLPFN